MRARRGEKEQAVELKNPSIEDRGRLTEAGEGPVTICLDSDARASAGA